MRGESKGNRGKLQTLMNEMSTVDLLTSKLTFTPLSLCSISTPPAEPPAPLELPLVLAFRAELLLVVAGVVYSCLRDGGRYTKEIYSEGQSEIQVKMAGEGKGSRG